MARVSVIVPAYNRERTVMRCIESLLAQTLSDIEIIVVNDGSTDGTLELLSAVKDDRLTVISQPNRGQGEARNAGMRLATGKYIGFTDDDDIVDKRMYEAMYEAAEKTGADMVQCGLRNVFPDGSEYIQEECKLNRTVTITDRADYIDKYFTPCIHCRVIANKIFRRGFIVENDIKFGSNKRFFAEDLFFNMEALKVLKKVCFISEPYYSYTYMTDNHSRTHKNDLERLVKINDLFRYEISSAPEGIKEAFMYTAALISVYNMGACEGADKDRARELLKSAEYRKWLKTALKRKCTPKHRLILSAMLLAPTDAAMKAAKQLFLR